MKEWDVEKERLTWNYLGLLERYCAVVIMLGAIKFT